MSLHASEGADNLWQAFAAPLRSFVARRVPPGVDADDVVQEVFLRIHERLPGLRDSDRLDAWIFRIARNILADTFRVRRRQHAFADRLADDELRPVPEVERAAVAELTACLAPMIAQLPDPCREALELTEMQGLTQVEAAQRAGISISGMKSRVQRGRERLKGIVLACCAVELDVRGGVTECEPHSGGGCGEWLRPSAGSNDYMGMTNINEAKTTTDDTATADAAPGCCGGPAPAGASACCALDAEKKASGDVGCGCATKAETTAKKGCC